MTKAEILDKLAEKCQMTKKLASESVDLVFSAISDVLVAGDEISAPGFGKFSVIVRIFENSDYNASSHSTPNNNLWNQLVRWSLHSSQRTHIET